MYMGVWNAHVQKWCAKRDVFRNVFYNEKRNKKDDSSSESDSDDDFDVEAEISVRATDVQVALAVLATELGLSDRQADAVSRSWKHYDICSLFCYVLYYEIYCMQVPWNIYR